MPLIIWRLKKDLPFPKILSPIVWCYIVGILIGNLPFFAVPTKIAQNISQFTVVFAIPLFLITTNISLLKYQAKKGILCFLLMVFSVFISSLLVGYLFLSVENIDKIVGMLAGIHSGGTPNMASVYLALAVPQNLYISLSTVQIAMGGIYLLFVTTLAKPLYERFLPKNKQVVKNIGIPEEPQNYELSLVAKGVFRSFLVALIIVAFSVFIVWNIFEKINVIALILTLTSISFLAALSPKIRHTAFAFDLGNYLMLVFSIAIGAMANITSLLHSGFDLVLITALHMFFAIVFHLIFSFLLKIDTETVIISSVASFFGPAFIGQIASAIGNKTLIAFGISCGILGYALGTYIGLSVAAILKYFVEQ